MERMPVTSSNIRAIGYDSDSQTLEVEFNYGSVYQYGGVPQDEHEAMMNADSKGTYLNVHIKGRYQFVKL
ncbi:MAG: KTSC domain-containing protein [Syntrophales bacterium]